jgi:glycerophosphoryl diester phosphodiesterase
MKPMKLSFLISLCVINVVSAQPNFSFFEPVKPPRPVQAMVHRGMWRAAPENSLLAVQICASDYVEWAEIDVRLTKDGKHIIIHDDTVDRTTNGKGKVADMTLDELKKLDAGSWFAARFQGTRLLTLPEILAASKGKINLYLDCKQIDPELLVREVIEAGMQQQVIVYDNPAVLSRVQSASKQSVATMTKYRSNMDLDGFIKEVHPAAVEIDADEVTPVLCKRFHAAKIKVQAKVLGPQWDTPEVWNRMIDAGIDWAQTDDPAGFHTFQLRKRHPQWPVKIAYHRGANRYAPENTLPAIREAVRLGADYIEIDIRTTADGKHCLLHDSKLDRTTSGKGLVKEKTGDEISKLDAGSWFGKLYANAKLPTFTQAIEAYGKDANFYLDCKDISPEQLARYMQKHQILDRSVVYQGYDYLAKLNQIEPRARGLAPFSNLEQWDKVLALKPFAVDASWKLVSKENIEKCHAAGIQFFSDALGLNENVEQYRKAIQCKIDVIQTDYPLRVLRAIELELAVAAR